MKQIKLGPRKKVSSPCLTIFKLQPQIPKGVESDGAYNYYQEGVTFEWVGAMFQVNIYNSSHLQWLINKVVVHIS